MVVAGTGVEASTLARNYRSDSLTHRQLQRPPLAARD